MKKNLLDIKNTGFITPKDYFEDLDEVLFSHAKLKEKVVVSGYKVPDEYFDSLEDKIVAASQKEQEPKVIKLITWHKMRYVCVVAASVALLITIFVRNNVKPVSMDTIETASIENYILNEDLEANEFASLFTEEELSDIRLINDGFSSQNIESYVFENLEIDDIITK